MKIHISRGGRHFILIGRLNTSREWDDQLKCWVPSAYCVIEEALHEVHHLTPSVDPDGRIQGRSMATTRRVSVQLHEEEPELQGLFEDIAIYLKEMAVAEAL